MSSLKPFTEAEAIATYAILVEHVGANPSAAAQADFVRSQTEDFFLEYRFQGSLGFGGKFYRGAMHPEGWVACYSEDATAPRKRAMAAANAALAELAEAAEGAE